jgi:hypothetical protein
MLILLVGVMRLPVGIGLLRLLVLDAWWPVRMVRIPWVVSRHDLGVSKLLSAAAPAYAVRS